jgi:hypothetical protein
MSNQQHETGHYRNVASFNALVQQCQLLGDAYKPSRADMSLASLNLKRSHANEVMERLIAAEATFSGAVAQRVKAYAGLPKLGTRIVAALECSDPDSDLIRAARHYLLKLRGARIGKTVAPAATVAADATDAPGSARQVSAIQNSFDARAQHFAHLAAIVAQVPGYTPNEAELTKDTLQNVAAQIDNCNRSVVDARYKLHLLQKERDQVLYAPAIGLLPTVTAIKKYLKMAFGTDSRELKSANQLVFTKNY